MNEQLYERFARRGSAPHTRHSSSLPKTSVMVSILPPRLNKKIFEYYQQQPETDATSHWLSRPEIPTEDEILDRDSSPSASDSAVEIIPNKPTGAWATKNEYLSAHYELLREQAVRPLREAVAVVKASPKIHEGNIEGRLKNQIGLYDRVRISAVKLCTRGVAVRVTFSLLRVGKRVIWEQSKRLTSGSLVALLPKEDPNIDKVVMAIVAARPVSLLLQNPPELYLFFADATAIEIDPAKEFLMVEAKSSFFEAERYTMMALQRMSSESFPMVEHLVQMEQDVDAPKHVVEHSKLNLSSVFGSALRSIDVLKDWPKTSADVMDTSQLEALKRMLQKRLAIIQGPPGTGKTWISVQALKIILANWRPNDPPVIVLAQTNHAVDQIVRHLLQFENQIVRLGGQSKDPVVKAKTLYEAREQNDVKPPADSQLGRASANIRSLQKQIEELLIPMRASKLSLNPRLLQDLRILSPAQVNSLIEGAVEWQIAGLSIDGALSAFGIWLGDALVPVPNKPKPEKYDFPFEAVELEVEALSELEKETAAREDEFFEKLFGPPDIELCDNFTSQKGHAPRSVNIAQILASTENLWDIAEATRPTVYRHLQSEMKKRICDKVRIKVKEYDKQAALRKVGRNETDENILKEQKVIAMTTTGFSKNRGLIQALSPRIVLCEEAAEVLEAPVAVTCVPSLQQLILVGDHLQLRPGTNCKALENHPFYLNISLFERLVKNGVEYTTLAMQRRMIPEVRRLLRPIYEDKLHDHESVKSNRPNVPGMGGINSFFFTHQWQDDRDDLMSSFNTTECYMIRGFVEYLVKNGVTPSQITCLTFYNGQRKALLKALNNSNAVSSCDGHVRVTTVDSYQGEENDIVLLSLVRSNDSSAIGFLSSNNRVCVALSRARCGFYIFGNGSALFAASTLWSNVIHIIAGRDQTDDRLEKQPNRLDKILPIKCVKHGTPGKIQEPDDWTKHADGGCERRCVERLPCGHPCPLSCHPSDHTGIVCKQCSRPASRSPRKNGSPSKQLVSPGKNTTTTLRSWSQKPPAVASGPATSWNAFAENASPGSVPPAKNAASTGKLIDYDGAAVGDQPASTTHGEIVYTVVSRTTKTGANGGQHVKEKSLATVTPVSPTKDWSRERSLLDE